MLDRWLSMKHAYKVHLVLLALESDLTKKELIGKKIEKLIEKKPLSIVQYLKS